MTPASTWRAALLVASFWTPGAMAAALPDIALQAERTVLPKDERTRLGLVSLAWSDSTLSLLDTPDGERLYGTAGDPISERCNGLVGVPASGLADLAHPAVPPRFGVVTAHPPAGSCLVAAPHNPAIAKFRTPACQADPICAEATPFDNDYTAMTSTVVLPDGVVVGFAHGEHQYWDGHGHQVGYGFYGRIGLYVSRDGGRHFTRYSERPVIEGNVRFETVYAQAGAFDISGGAALQMPDGQIRVYYSDEYDPLPAGDPDASVAASCGVCIAVAEISTHDLAAAIAAGRLPVFQKYYRGGFTQPGLGGRFSPVVSPNRLVDPHSAVDEEWIVWPSVARAASRDLFVMAYMSQWGGIRLRTSADGLTGWSDGMFIAPHRADDAQGPPIPATPYPTIIADGPGHRSITGDEFFLYYQSSDWNQGFDWTRSAVVRRLVSLAPGSLANMTGYFSYSGGYLGFTNGLGHYCTIADAAAFAKLNADRAIPATAAHVEPSEVGWIDDGACLG